MRNLYILMIMLALLVATGCTHSTTAKEGILDIRAMSFNIRYGLANDGDNNWQHRKDFVCEVIRDYQPDILGVQEALRFQMDVLNRCLPGYGEIGIGRDGGSEGEYSAIFYRKDRFAVNDSGTFWLSQTPEVHSQDWGAALPRIATWAKLQDKQSKQSVKIYNTHFDHMSQLARTNSAKLIMQKIVTASDQAPFVLMGDLNAAEGNPAIGYLKGTSNSDAAPMPLVDSWRVLHPKEKIAGTFHAFKGNLDGP